jgi:hypothetical protein
LVMEGSRNLVKPSMTVHDRGCRRRLRFRRDG